MKSIRFGIIGGGLMGREFAAATARWCTLVDPVAKPEIVALASGRESSFPWFTSNFPSIKQATTNWRELLNNDAIDVLYIAVPHHMHAEMYIAAIEAGKHLFGEKPFGIDLSANTAILADCQKHPNVFVRCSSEFPFFPGAQKIGDMLDAHAFGKIIEVNTGFLHSSDLDPNKAINWKRQNRTNGEYGCMGDLGMHVCHMPFRAGWIPQNTRAILAKIFAQRPDGKGGTAPCDTWDNATLLSTSADATGHTFPWTLKTFRISPGERNTWYIEVLGTNASARWSTREPKVLDLLEYKGKDQTWQRIQVGYEPAFKTITGPNFEFGFPDCFVQMLAGYLHELVTGKPLKKFAGCVTPEETALSHRLFTAAIQSQRDGAVIPV